MTDDLDEIRALYRPRGPHCSIGVFLSFADERLRQRILDAMDVAAAGTDAKVTWAVVSDYLKLLGHPIADQTLRRHHRARCLCGR